MSEERRRIIDKAKKLKELADRGVGGEKDNAKRMYEAYKKKHNLTDEDVKGHEYSDDFINDIKNKTDEELLEEIGKGLIILGVGLLAYLLSEIFTPPKSKREREKRRKRNAKRASELKDTLSKMKNKNNKPKNTDDDIPESDEQKEIMKEIELNLKKDKKNES